jgi:hypothetical protein
MCVSVFPTAEEFAFKLKINAEQKQKDLNTIHEQV